MKRMPRTWLGAAVGTFALMSLAGCVAGGGYGGDVGVGYVGYVGEVYEPAGYEYGGWGRGYRVGPPRGGVRGPVGRAPPSIPRGARGGGGHSGGKRP
jgi:hypothetical protein